MEAIHGIDFSAAIHGGRSTWICRAVTDGSRLRVEWCAPACSLPGSGRHRDAALAALVSFVRSRPDALFGFDFPFSLPASLMAERDWETFVARLPERYGDAAAFRAGCRLRSGGHELKRATETASRTPFSCYNLRLYRQTWHGIRDVLRPLVTSRSARVLPMQRPLAGAARVIEICPASTLKQEGLYRPYKGRNREHEASRRDILRAVARRHEVVFADDRIPEILAADRGGDALDSLVAACAVRRAARSGALEAALEPDDPAWKEGFVYV